MDKPTDEEIEHRFSYHQPKTTQPERYELIRKRAREFARDIVRNTPASLEQQRALDYLDLVVMLANASIARYE